MSQDIDTTISGNDCPLCLKYGECELCPLMEIGEGCTGGNSAWAKLKNAFWKKWKDVVEAEEKYMIPVLKRCLK